MLFLLVVVCSDSDFQESEQVSKTKASFDMAYEDTPGDKTTSEISGGGGDGSHAPAAAEAAEEEDEEEEEEEEDSDDDIQFVTSNPSALNQP